MLREHCARALRPTSYLGCCVPNFPNFFMITGPIGPFTNIPPAIKTAREEGEKVVEATQEAEDGLMETCEAIAKGSSFTVTDSWIFGMKIC